VVDNIRDLLALMPENSDLPHQARKEAGVTIEGLSDKTP
jgi:hypothetical protein